VLPPWIVKLRSTSSTISFSSHIRAQTTPLIAA
jgi:hypothetical protein